VRTEEPNAADLVRSTVLEVIRLRDLIVEIDHYRESAERSWKEEGLGQLVALYQFRILMQAERSRTGYLSPPNPSGGALYGLSACRKGSLI
jgi:hypothetical protein